MTWYEIDDKLSDVDKAMLLMALKFHPHREEKIGSGAVGHHAEHKDSRCFVLERDDGTFEDFSYKKCVFGALEIIAPSRAKLYQTRWAKNGTTQKV
uniref:Uncharacterized protein n=1 Tax=Chenopodium quinoa TaxID=63459 RepID=A0A803LQS4_CHEQI